MIAAMVINDDDVTCNPKLLSRIHICESVSYIHKLINLLLIRSTIFMVIPRHLIDFDQERAWYIITT